MERPALEAAAARTPWRTERRTAEFQKVRGKCSELGFRHLGFKFKGLGLRGYLGLYVKRKRPIGTPTELEAHSLTD